MTKQRATTAAAAAAATGQPHQSQRDQRSASESGPDNENDQDNDLDMDADHEDDQDSQANYAGETARIKRRRLTQACDVCRKKKIKCGKSKSPVFIATGSSQAKKGKHGQIWQY